MKVLHFAYACDPKSGSEAGCGWNWAWHLAELGHEIWVLTNSEGQDNIEKALAQTPMPNLHFMYIDVPAWLKRYVRAGFTEFYRVYTYYLGWQKRAYKVALSLDKEHDFDLVHHVTWSGINTGSWLCNLNKPFLFGPIGGGQVTPEAYKKYFVNYWRNEVLRSFMATRLIVFNQFVRKTVRRADLVLVTNRDTLDIARQLGAQRIEMFLDSGLPEDYIPQEPPSRSTSVELKLLWVGGIYPRKGLRLALECLSQVNPLIPYKMTILGDGVESHYVPSWLEEFGVENHVVYRGRVSWIEVKKEYLESDVFLFTSLRDSFGGQLLEAMAHALPIISLNHQGARDFVPERAGIKAPMNNPTETVKALAQAIEYMFNHPKEREEMGRIGYEFAKTQTWRQKAIDMSEYYKKVACGARSIP
jgi:glycosyltransferase involved in cell wall biosynthesis